MDEKTDYQISFCVNDGILEIVVMGQVAKEDLNKLHAEIIAIVKEQNTGAALCDIHALGGRYDDFAEAYFRARSIPRDVRNMHFAVVDPSKNEAYKSFYITTAANAGQTMRWFPDIESARAWLKSQIK